MASVVGICNSALVKLGATRIVQLTEGSKNANLCNEQYDKIRDDLLRAHTWNFAAKRSKLAQLAKSPRFGFAKSYQLPSDFLRVISVHADSGGRSSAAYKIEGRVLLTDAADLYLRYIRRVSDPNDMDAIFREALAWALATDLAIPITQSSGTFQQMSEGLRGQLSKARSVDAIEDFPETDPVSNWILERN